MKPARLFLISSMYPSLKTPYYGVFVKKSEKHLSELGIRFTAKSVISGLERNRFRKSIKYVLFLLSVWTNLLFHFRYDIIYSHFVLRTVEVLKMYHRRAGSKPIIVNFHGSDVIAPDGSPRLLGSAVFDFTRLFIVPSPFFKNYIKKHHGVQDNRIFISPSGGIDTKIFCRSRQEWPEAHQTITIGYFSRISAGKGWAVFVDALNLLKLEGVQFVAKMIGGGTQHQMLHTKIAELGLTQHVEVVGALSHDQLPAVLNTMDLNVFSTELHESLGLVSLEAMACGVPVAGSRIGAIPSYIEHEKNGYLFEKGNYRELAKMIMHYYALSAAKKAEMSDQAVQSAIQYDSLKVAEELYQKILDVRNTR